MRLLIVEFVPSTLFFSTRQYKCKHIYKKYIYI